MASVKEIEPPHILASLPRPIDSVNGRAVAACVHGLRGPKKRKRFEVAVGIDGEGINIYNVQNPRLLTSYAIPPHAYFITAPTSVYRKASSGQPARRYTYASIAHSHPARLNPQIICFREDVQRSSVGDAEKFTFDVSSRQSDIAAIETVSFDAGYGADEHNVLVVYKNGSVECVTADLGTNLWTSNIDGVRSSSSDASIRSKTIVEHVCVTTSDAARRALLKNREDVVALLDPSLKRKSSQLAALPLLCTISCVPESSPAEGCRRTLRLFALRTPSSGGMKSDNAKIQHLVTWQLPLMKEMSMVPNETSQFSLHFGTGTLQQLISGVIVSYDFSGGSPKVISVFRSPKGPVKSFTRLSSSLTFAVSSAHIGVYDVRYNALQGVLSYPPGNTPDADTKKRKRDSSSVGMEWHSTITYLSEIGLAIGLAGKDLVGIQLAEKFPMRERQSDAGLLVNSISKGVDYCELYYGCELASRAANPFSHKVVSTQPTDMWTLQMKLLDNFAQSGDVFNFERVFAEAVGISYGGSKDDAAVETSYGEGDFLNQINGMRDPLAAKGPSTDVEHLEKAPLRHWNFSKEMTESERMINRPKAMYALAKIFEWSPAANSFENMEPSESSISIRFLPPNVFQWLLSCGFLSRDLIEQSLHHACSAQERIKSVKDGDIVTSVYNHDRKMILLYSMLNSKAFLEINEVVRAIQIIIQSLDSTPLAHLASDLFKNADASETTNEIDASFDEEVEAATDAIDQALETLENGILIRSRTLRPALVKLHSFPRSLIIQALRTVLNHHDLVFLMHLLRIELGDGGWTSRYFADSVPKPDEETDNPSDGAIVIIGNLLSCVLDAVGLRGWLITTNGNSSTEDAQDDVIDLLRQEISAALEGIHEATFMKGLLAEFLRFCYRDANTEKPPSHLEDRLRKRPFLVSKQDSDYEALQKRLLPLGLRPSHAAQETWKRDNGGQWKPRSAREIGQDISKQVPKYSIERIRV